MFPLLFHFVLNCSQSHKGRPVRKCVHSSRQISVTRLISIIHNVRVRALDHRRTANEMRWFFAGQSLFQSFSKSKLAPVRSLLSSISPALEEWKITVVNKTGDSGLRPATVKFMLFQVARPTQLSIASRSTAWRVSEVGYPGSIGPIVLPSEVQFYVKDRSCGNLRNTGPFDIATGQAYSVVQKTIEEVPRVQLAPQLATPGEIKIINEKGNAKPLDIVLSKDGHKLLSVEYVRPATVFCFDIEPAVYVATVDDVCAHGADFRAVLQADRSTKFHLDPRDGELTIWIKQLKSGEIVFVPSSAHSRL